MYYKAKRKGMPTVNNIDDKRQRYDYEKYNVEFSSAIIGSEDNIKDSR